MPAERKSLAGVRSSKKRLRMESPGSPLSEHSDDEFPDHEEYGRSYRNMSNGASPSPTDASQRPTKRQRTSGPNRERVEHTGFEHLPAPHPDEDVESDTDGSVPGSPHLGPGVGPSAVPGDEDEYSGFGGKGEQISSCRWDGCDAGELGNMDLLVQHLADVHIHAKQKRYSCEWADCTRKGIAHASGYALRAHMRSHTREKPFYCTLPECDRSFTRSDALAKHMRTVHETEALRPSDPVPKHHSSNPQNKNQKLRLTFKAASNGTAASDGKSGPSLPQSPLTGPAMATADEDYERENMVWVPASGASSGPPDAMLDYVKQFPQDVSFTDEELALPPRELFKVLRAQFRWVSEESETLRAEISALDERRRNEWTAKELAMENLIEGETVRMQRRGADCEEDRAIIETMVEDIRGKTDTLELQGPTPWWRLPSKKEHGGAMEDIETAPQTIAV